MHCKPLFRSLSVAAVLAFGVHQTAYAATEIQFWHAMEAALGERLNTIANDLANMNTTGFKSQSVNFSDLFYQQIGSTGSGDPIQLR